MSRHPQPETPAHREKRPRLDLAEVRHRLEGRRGEDLWTSLEEVADTEEFRSFLESEFPEQASLLDRPMERRRFLQLMGASLALAGATACRRQPTEGILPYVDQPEGLVPGEPLTFASALAPTGDPVGVLVESHEGHPVKISGNPSHPASLGATNVFLEAMILGLYDPERSQVTTHRGDIATWKAFSHDFRQVLEPQGLQEGSGLRILTGAISSPSLAAKLEAVLERFPRARWHQYEPVSRESSRAAALEVFGRPVDPIYDLSEARIVVSLDADFLGPGRPGSLLYARQWSAWRRVDPKRGEMNRLYVIEPAPTVTGASADHRLALPPSKLPAMLQALAARLDVPGLPSSASEELDAEALRHLDAIASDLQRNPGASVVLAGDGQPPSVHALAHALNERLGNVDRTVRYIPSPSEGGGESTASLVELTEAMHAGRVDALLVLDANPVHDAPRHLDFAGALERVPFSVHLGLYDDETAEICQWHLPQLHPLETWSDLRAFDGTVAIAQPLIEPLYRGISANGILDVALGEAPSADYDALRAFWQERAGAADFETWWRRALHEGVVPDTAFSSVALRGDLRSLPRMLRQEAPSSEDAGGYELVFRPDPTLWDGRFANNAWLQELPDPLTKLTWDNAAWVSPATAEEQGLANGDLVTLRRGDRSVEAPIWIVPGQADRVIAVHLGYGRTACGAVGEGAGFDAYALRSADRPWHEGGWTLTPTGRSVQLASTQHHHRMEGRHLVRRATREQYRRDPDFAHHHEHEELSLYPEYEYDSYAWGMTIDLASCIGCNACTIACQAENNIPVVGREQVRKGREMHWIRIDRYYAGPLDDPETYFQPLPCMHCEKAPCEVVCPVNATVHDSEGLNAMVYNRCVGTRYCSNNCPYKVRRFNFFDYVNRDAPVLELLHNPDVTVRSRGVMEKCTYCVQRISRARIDAKTEGRTIRDGEVQTACQTACPTRAIVFGDTNDPESEVARHKTEPRNYDLLGSLNTRPRTSYLAELRNPHPDLRPPASPEDHAAEGGGSSHG